MPGAAGARPDEKDDLIKKKFELRDITRLPGDPLRDVIGGGKVIGVTKWPNTPSEGEAKP